MQRLVDKYGLYCQHLQHAISETKSANDHATLKEKLENFIDAKGFLWSCMFVDVLSAAKQFSLFIQKSDIDIISIVDSVESTKLNYETFLGKFEADAENIFTLSTLKSVSKVTKRDSHHTKGRNWNITKKRNSIWETTEFLWCDPSCCITKIERYSHVYSKTGDNNAVSDGDKVLFDVCQALNSAVWLSLTKDESEDDQILSVQFAAINNLFERFQTMSVFKSITCDSLQTGFVDVVWCYLDVENIKPVSFWFKICKLVKDREPWHDNNDSDRVMLMYTFSNATFERFCSHLKVVKMELRSRLLSESLNSLMRICMKGLSINNFDKDSSSQCVSHWYGSKE